MAKFNEIMSVYKYTVEKYGGRLYCGNAVARTLDECIAFADDGLCDKAIIYDGDTGAKLYTVKIAAND